MKRRSFLGAIVALFGGGVAMPSYGFFRGPDEVMAPFAQKNAWGVYLGPDRGIGYFTDEQLRDLGYATLQRRTLTRLWHEYEYASENQAARERDYFGFNPYFGPANKADAAVNDIIQNLIGPNG